MQETKLPGDKQMTAIHGYEFFGCGVRDDFSANNKKSKFNAHRCKLMHGVGILLRLDKKKGDNVEIVNRISQRLIWVAGVVGGARVCVFSAYAPHND